MPHCVLISFQAAIFIILLCLPRIGLSQVLLPTLRISVENAPTHVQTMAVRRFAEELTTRLEGVLDVKFSDSAQLYRDRDVFTALREGKLEMAVPGTWQVARFESNISLFLLPEFYGRSANATYKVLQSSVGKELNTRIEQALGVVIVGTWLDLGYANLFSTNKKITSLHDIQGMRIRVAGGRANELRLQAAGAETLTIPWPDFPLWLGKREVDGVLTTYETIRSAKLWEKGLAFAYEDKEYFPQYIPIINRRFWSKLPQNVRETIIECWENAAEWEHGAAVHAQQEARNTLKRNGIAIVTPSQEELTSARTFLLKYQDDIVKKLGLDQNLVMRSIELLHE
ncbi:TRAP transporter substrate-binding protein DctP [Desulfovibrio inopinatus]|uniref:TRAP transporter substrate-binding protein DctP n=1 Tax=Desulfovibrio inopinatus TaxID=102109 RepID=UPI0005542CE1|nr:TRAP transporter substrate-binding protein DctP [Desulfovibrio inopinatus]